MGHIVVVTLIGLNLLLAVRSEECTPIDYKLYATKTVYETVRWKENIDNQCEPVHMWLLSSHGTRFAELEDHSEILNRVKLDVVQNATQGSLCESDLEALNNWQLRFDPKDDLKLAETGWAELRGLGTRHKALYPSLFPSYEEEQYLFRHTNYSTKGNRTLDSARAYAKGVFGSYDGVDFIESGKPDWLLHFYKSCDKYEQEVGDQPVEEMDKFIAGPEMDDVLKETAVLLGLRQDYVDYELLDEVYDMCRVERGIFGESPWCALLTQNALKVLEFAEDIKYFWEDSYGHEISYQPTCALIMDVVQIFNDAVNNNGRRVTASFANSQTLNNFFARIGLFKDGENLKADGFVRQADRKWRVSLHTPMASNIALVLKNCSSVYKVEAFVNEKPTLIPGCDALSCDYGTVLGLLQPVADNCDVEEICRVDSEVGPNGSGANHIILNGALQLGLLILSTLSLSLYK